MANLHRIRRSARGSAMAGPVCVKELAALPVKAFVGVGAEVVPLGLQQVGRESFAATAVKVLQGA